MEIKDSGNRREFASGAVRDISDDKGAMDLLPYDILSNFALYFDEHINDFDVCFDIHILFDAIYTFVINNNIEDIYKVLTIFIKNKYEASLETAIIEYSKILQAGSHKYKKYNWMIGIPTHCFLDSGLRHAMKYLRGDTDEPHDRAFMWNFFGLIWTKQHHPELDDIFYGDTYNADVINKYDAMWNKKEMAHDIQTGLFDTIQQNAAMVTGQSKPRLEK